MSKEILHKIEYTVMCINEFSERHSLSVSEAYRYLKTHGGISFLKDCYDAEHLLSIDDAIDDITLVCARHGGKIA